MVGIADVAMGALGALVKRDNKLQVTPMKGFFENTGISY
jgi:hypothetical protein